MQDYYTVRAGSMDYTDYWEMTVDPDGNVRNRMSQEERQQFLQDHKDEIAFLHKYRYVDVLDFGAGVGWLLDECLTHPWQGYAIEECPTARDVLLEKKYTLLDGMADARSSRFDLVICHHVIEHLIDPVYAINHIHRVLKKGGWLMMSTPDFGSPCAKRFGDKFRLLHDPTHISLFTLESMSRMLRDYGFTIRETMFPFPERYATAENFARWNDTSKVSPPWPGNVFTMFCTRD